MIGTIEAIRNMIGTIEVVNILLLILAMWLV
ncbi:unnamed protein product, partial [marine sediment metagenome]